MMRAVFLAAALAGGVASADAAPLPPYEVAPRYDGVQRTSRHIASHDGTRLAITIFRPTRGGQVVAEPLPVIVTQDRSQAETRNAIRYFTDRGYVWVAQDRRGTGASFGVQTGFVDRNDARDAKAVIEWAGAQPFSSRKVVTLGCSNQGAWQYVTAALDPQYLVAITPACASPQFFDHGVTLDGVPIFPAGASHYAGECNRPVSGARPAGFVPPPPAPVDGDVDGALVKAAVEQQKCGAAMLGQYWLNMPRDGFNAFAKYRPALEDSAITQTDAVRRAGVAMLQIGGWFDAAVAGQFAGQQVLGGRVIMGPWVHGNRLAPDSVFPDAELDLNAETLRWFDFHAKGVRNGADQPRILYYTINAPAGREWRQADRWRPAGDALRTYYFTPAGLSPAKPAASGRSVSYAQQDVAWFDGKYAPLARWWRGDMTAADDKSLSHTAPPLAADIEVTGTPTARLWVSADAPDVNVFAVLEDVGPDGRSTYVTDGRLRASWRKLHTPTWGRTGQHWHRGFTEDIAPLTPGMPVELVFDFFPVSYVFKQGHRPRVSIVTSIGQAYQAPPLAAGKPVTLTLYRDARRPSSILLPTVRAR